MSIASEYNRLLDERKKIEDIDDWDNTPVIKEMIKLFTSNMNETIEFIETECTAEQFSWLSEIFDDIARASNSKAFIKALRCTAKKYPQTTKKYNIEYFIDCAEEQIQ